MTSSSDRLASLERMLGNRPDDARLRFGVALEYLNAGRAEEGVRELKAYLDSTDDEGNAWGRLADALVGLGREGEARAAYEAGIRAAMRNGHPSMAQEFEEALEEMNP